MQMLVINDLLGVALVMIRRHCSSSVMARLTITKLDHRSIELADHTHMVDHHQPTRDEAIALTGWSYPRIKRAISTARLLGVQIVSVRAHGGAPYYRLEDSGPLDPAALRRLYKKAWL